MTIRRLSSSGSVGLRQPSVSNQTVSAGTRTSAAVWVRPPAWTALPDLSGQQRFAGLHRIDVEGNFVAFSASGNYTVDWGDGTTNNYSSGAVAYKQYDYTTISSTGESALGYRQVVIQVYPQSGQTLTGLSLQQNHNLANLGTGYSTGWLDIAINAPNMAALTIGGSKTHAYLQQVTIISHAVTNMQNMFYGCSSLTSVPLFNTAAVTNMQSMFQNCSSLTSVPLFNTAAVTNMQSMFYQCSSLTSVPLFNTAAATNMQYMFYGCACLASVPLFNTAAATNMGLMFYGCACLTSVPLFNTAAVTNMQSMFYQCSSLTSVPLFNTAAVTSMASMFYGCACLASVPLFNTAAATNMQFMFYGCACLTSVPLFNTAAATSMGWIFQNCYSLTSVPLFNTAAVTSMASMFYGCACLASVPLFNTAAATNMQFMFYGCASLTSVPLFNTAAVTSGNFAFMFTSCSSLFSCAMTGINQTISFASCKLSATQINAILTNLSSTGTGKTITVSGNYGAAACTTSIATAKGWTVTT